MAQNYDNDILEGLAVPDLLESHRHLLARSHLQSSYKNRFQYFLATLQSNSIAAMPIDSKCEDLHERQ